MVDLILNADVKPLDLPLWELIKGYFNLIDISRLLEKDPLKRWGWDKISKFLNISCLNVPS